MHLINTTTLELHSFLGEIPAYVILSHTWSDDEVTFESMHQPNALTKTSKGYAKIKQCCEQAKEDGYNWVWVDTCCIDKRSSAELSEAINSMYRYYWEADKCYAYLSDVSVMHNPNTRLDMSTGTETCSVLGLSKSTCQTFALGPQGMGGFLIGSRWFRRGWTLQELLAPAVVEFYDEHWVLLGTRSSLATEIQVITDIHVCYMLDRSSINTASMGLRLSWASNRKTTRDEDIAYCLLGIVGVNMPLLYGEGKRAFRRLQVELLRKTRDHTIFMWSAIKRWPSDESPDFNDKKIFLAPSPTHFETPHLENVRPTFLQPLVESSVLEMTALGLHITLPCIEESFPHEITAMLDCLKGTNTRIGIVLLRRRDGRYERSKTWGPVEVSPADVKLAVTKELYILDEDLEEREDVERPWCAFKVDRLIIEGIPESDAWIYTINRTPMVNARVFCDQVVNCPPDDTVEFTIAFSFMRVTILVGDFHGQSWLKPMLRESILSARMATGMTVQFRRGVLSEYLRDHVTASRGTQMRVDVHARKKLLNQDGYETPCWLLAIHVRAGSAMPSC